MSNEEIKTACEIEYTIIKDAELELKRLRELCKHEETFKGTYSYRVGSYEECDICSFCGTPVNYLNRYIFPDQSQNKKQ